MRSKRTFLLILIFLFLFSGCQRYKEKISKSHLEKAEKLAKKSQFSFEDAEREYKLALISAPNVTDVLKSLGFFYYRNRRFAEAIDCLRNLFDENSLKYLAISYYNVNDFTTALSVFNKKKEFDEESLYYFGLTCEEMHLYPQVLNLYQRIEKEPFLSKAKNRSESLDPQPTLRIEPFLATLLVGAPEQSDYPESSAVVLYQSRKIELLLDNKKETNVHLVIKILNARGIEEYGEIKIGYDSTYTKVKIVSALTVTPEGEVFRAGEKHIHDVSVYPDFPMYDNVRLKIISMPSLEKDAVIEIKYKTIEINPIPEFIGVTFLCSPNPVKWEEFSIDLPKEKERSLKSMIFNEIYNTFNAELAPRIIKGKDKTTYYWEFRNLPAITPEPYMPDYRQIVPGLLFSTFSSWRQIYDWWWNLVKDKIQLDQNLKEKVRELTKDKFTLQEKAEAIYNFVQKDIRYVAIEYGLGGYEPRSAKETFRNRYGDCKDKTILLISMLGEAGIEAYPVLLGGAETLRVDDTFPSLNFNHVIVALKIGQDFIFCDPTYSTLPFGQVIPLYQGQPVLVVLKEGPKIMTIPFTEEDENVVERKTKIFINPDGSISVSRETSRSGYYAFVLRRELTSLPPKIITDFLKEDIQMFCPGGKLKDYKLENLEILPGPLKIHLEFTGEKYLSKIDSLRILPPLVNFSDIIGFETVALEKRLYHLDFLVPSKSQNTIEIELPFCFQLKSLPPNFKRDSAWMSFEVRYSQRNNRIIFTLIQRIKRRWVSKEEYKDFKKFLGEVSQSLVGQHIILREI